MNKNEFLHTEDTQLIYPLPGDVGTAGALPVMESFYTIQGEGFHQGRAAYGDFRDCED